MEAAREHDYFGPYGRYDGRKIPCKLVSGLNEGIPAKGAARLSQMSKFSISNLSRTDSRVLFLSFSTTLIF
jgi:hypothetical protein